MRMAELFGFFVVNPLNFNESHDNLTRNSWKFDKIQFFHLNPKSQQLRKIKKNTISINPILSHRFYIDLMMGCTRHQNRLFVYIMRKSRIYWIYHNEIPPLTNSYKSFNIKGKLEIWQRIVLRHIHYRWKIK